MGNHVVRVWDKHTPLQPTGFPNRFGEPQANTWASPTALKIEPKALP
jgi:hypothetical protein